MNIIASKKDAYVASYEQLTRQQLDQGTMDKREASFWTSVAKAYRSDIRDISIDTLQCSDDDKERRFCTLDPTLFPPGADGSYGGFQPNVGDHELGRTLKTKMVQLRGIWFRAINNWKQSGNGRRLDEQSDVRFSCDGSMLSNTELNTVIYNSEHSDELLGYLDDVYMYGYELFNKLGLVEFTLTEMPAAAQSSSPDSNTHTIHTPTNTPAPPVCVLTSRIWLVNGTL